MIARISHFSLNPYRATSFIAFVVLIFLATTGHASAQTFVDTLHSCELRKLSAVTIKLLAVYASHIFTINVEPGLGRGGMIRRYMGAALLPSSFVQGGWFISWALIDTLYGSVVRAPLQRRARQRKAGHKLSMIEMVRDGSPTTENAGNGSFAVRGVKDGMPVADGMRSKMFSSESMATCIIAMSGVATVGSIVTMIQQYVHLFQC